MARHIKETPVLTGKDAERFSKIIKDNETKKIKPEDYKRAQEAYKNCKFVYLRTTYIGHLRSGRRWHY